MTDMRNDDELMAQLRLALAHDPVPAHVTAGARAAFLWRTIDAELAELVYDSFEAQPELAGVRGGGDARLLTFETPTLVVDVEVTAAGHRRRLLGHVHSELPGPLRLELRHAEATRQVTLDARGQFVAEGVAPGAMSLRCHSPGGSSSAPTVVDTPWVMV